MTFYVTTAAFAASTFFAGGSLVSDIYHGGAKFGSQTTLFQKQINGFVTGYLLSRTFNMFSQERAVDFYTREYEMNEGQARFIGILIPTFLSSIAAIGTVNAFKSTFFATNDDLTTMQTSTIERIKKVLPSFMLGICAAPVLPVPTFSFAKTAICSLASSASNAVSGAISLSYRVMRAAFGAIF